MTITKTQGAFICIRCVVLSVAMIWLCYIGYYRFKLYITNTIVHQKAIKDIDKPWFETMICFGPRFSQETVNFYMRTNDVRRHHPDTWKRKINKINKRFDNLLPAITAIDSLEKYRDFFLHKFNWSVDSMYELGLHVTLDGFFGLGWFKHTFSETTYRIRDLQYAATYFSFRHAFCYNYTYGSILDAPGGSSSIEKKKGSKSGGEALHRIGLHAHQYDWLLKHDIIAEYVDLFVYPKGHGTEFPLIEDQVPFRVDMKDWQRLRASVVKVVRQNHAKFRCVPTPISGERNHTYSYAKCLTWCLRRALLRNVKCVLPELDEYIYNMTKIFTLFGTTSVGERKPFRSAVYFNNDTVKPWMTEFLHLKLCDSKAAFRDTFAKFAETFFPTGDKRYPLDESCEEQCRPECDEYRVLIATVGTELHPSDEKLHGVVTYFSGQVEEISESWQYKVSQLLIDISGVMSFLLGLSLISIHDWCFSLTQWLITKCKGRKGAEAMPPELEYLRDDLRYDDYHEYPDEYQEYPDGYEGLPEGYDGYPEEYQGYYDEYQGSDGEYEDYDGEYQDYDGEYQDYDGEYQDYDGKYEDYGDEHQDHSGDEQDIVSVEQSHGMGGPSSPVADKPNRADNKPHAAVR